MKIRGALFFAHFSDQEREFSGGVSGHFQTQSLKGMSDFSDCERKFKSTISDVDNSIARLSNMNKGAASAPHDSTTIDT